MYKPFCIITALCYCLSGAAQNEQKMFWALNGSPPGFIWDNITGDNVIDNGNGTWNTTNKTWTYNKGLTDQVWRPGAYAIFGGSPGTLAAGTVTVSGTQIVNYLTFNPAVSGNFTLSGGTITNNSGNVFVNASATMSTVLAGTAGLTLTGTGTLTLSTNLSTYTGTTTINSGATLVLSNGTSGSLTPTLSTPVVLNSGGTLSGDILAVNINIAGAISGPGTLTLTNSSSQGQTMRLYGSNSGFTGTYVGPSTGRGLMWSDNAGTGNAANTGSASANWNVSNSFAFIETAGSANPIVQLGSLSGTNTSTTLGAFGGSGVKTFQIGALSTNTSFAGAIQDNPQGNGSSTIALIKVGSGTLTLSGTNTYSGSTTINAGTLAFTSAVPSSNTWNIAVNATGTPGTANSGLITAPAPLTLAGKTINIVLTGTSTGFTWTAMNLSGTSLLGILAPTLQLNGTTIASGSTVSGTTVTYNGNTITVKR